ncbi:unnamed protein product [Ixodes pacificus]
MRPQLLPFLAAVLLSLCWTSAEHKDVFLETDRSYKYDLPSPGKPGANSNCTGKCVHVFMGLLCDFVDDNADCGEQFLRCCVGGIFSRGFTRKSGTSVDMMDDSPTEQQIPNDVTTPSPSNDDHPVADPPPPKEPKPTQPTSPEKGNADQETLTAMESLQSPQIESPLPEPAASTTASTSNSGWIPFHQAYQPVNKQKVAENHHNNSSEFTPMRGVFQNPNQEPRDPNVCGVRGVKNRTNHPQSQGGTEARPGEWCWHAAIVNRKNQYICNGALISAQWVLTAADCVLNHTNATENIYVRLGYTDIMSPYNPPGAQTKTVAKAYVHHSFNKDTLANNIALLKLKDIVELNGAVCVVCLPHRQKLALEQRSEKEDCVATGYGSSAKEDDLTYNYPRLIEASVAVLMYSDGCRSSEPRARQLELAMDVTGSYFCAGHGDVEEDCRGDPGRLLVCPNGDYFEISGIASQGLSCGGPDALALYTNVSSYSGWINQIANVNRF